MCVYIQLLCICNCEDSKIYNKLLLRNKMYSIIGKFVKNKNICT